MSRIRRPKWGQHFLKDQYVCRQIADSLRFQPDDVVVEIGAGRGAMTRLLARRARRLVAVEIDPALASNLEEEFSRSLGVEILRQDILKVDFPSLLRRQAERCYVFGNLPYYLTSPILHHLFKARAFLRHMALMMQREVAERVTATPGTRAYGYLSVLAQVNAEPRITLSVPPGAFSPPPKVHSALVDFGITGRFPQWDDKTYGAFLKFGRLCFQQKRKNLLNNLAQKYSRSLAQRVLESHALEPRVRAEQLSLRQLAEIFETVKKITAASDR